MSSVSVTLSTTASPTAGTGPVLVSAVSVVSTAAGTSVAVSGPGTATLAGDDGPDVFVYTSTRDSTGAGRDVILDFQPGIDRIDLSRIDADPLLPGDQAFVFTPGGLTGTAGQVTFVDSSLRADTNGDGVPDLDIYLPKVSGLSAEAARAPVTGRRRQGRRMRLLW